MSKDNRIHTALTLILCLLLFACHNDSSDSTEASILNRFVDGNCSVNDKNNFVYQEMRDSYLWYDTVPIIDPKQYTSPEAVLEATRYQALDRFSYITSTEEFNAFFFSGEYIGLGLSVNTEGYIRYVFKDSPADTNGIQRGDRILFVNDISLSNIMANNLWDSIFGEQVTGVQVAITLEKVDSNNIVALNLSKQTVVQNTVLHRSVIDLNPQKVGYLVFKSFTNLSYSELAEAFQYFNAENIDELILDLRYNGGGFLDVAKVLASLIGGPRLQNELFYQLTRNDKYSHQNINILFSNEANALNLSKLTVLTTEQSCSASEAIINGLNPFLDVKVVGETSCGKPVGMSNPEYCDMILAHIEFKGTNSVGFGDYFDGFEPDCVISDTAEHDFGDTNEALLSEALYLIQNSNCSPKSKSTQKPTKNSVLQPWNFTKDPYRQ